jgi:hypothetical protein
MATHVVTKPSGSTWIEHEEPLVPNDHAEFVQAPECRRRSGRGAITGVLIGAGLWAMILTATGVIKL